MPFAVPHDAIDVDRVVDDFVDTYVAWREQCIDVQCAYERWASCGPDSNDAYTIYRAELEFEEHAARALWGCTQRLAALAA